MPFSKKVKALNISRFSYSDKMDYYEDLAKNWEIEEPMYFSNKYSVPVSVIQQSAQWLRRRGIRLTNKSQPSSPSVLANKPFLLELKRLHNKSLKKE